MLEFFIGNIFFQCSGRIFQQTIDIQMETNCSPLLADLFCHSFEADFIVDMSIKNHLPDHLIPVSAIKKIGRAHV